MESIVLLILAVIALIVVWPMVVPARNSAVLKMEGLEKETIISEQKAELKRAQKRDKIKSQLEEMDGLVSSKELDKLLAGKFKKAD